MNLKIQNIRRQIVLNNFNNIEYYLSDKYDIYNIDEVEKMVAISTFTNMEMEFLIFKHFRYTLKDKAIVTGEEFSSFIKEMAILGKSLGITMYDYFEEATHSNTHYLRIFVDLYFEQPT